MRLQCDVEVVSRLLPTCGLRGRGRGTRALLSLGREPGRARGGVCLMVCTARNRPGVCYRVRLRAGGPRGFPPRPAQRPLFLCRFGTTWSGSSPASWRRAKPP